MIYCSEVVMNYEWCFYVCLKGRRIVLYMMILNTFDLRVNINRQG